MTVSELADIATIFTAMGTLAVAFFVYQWTRQADTNQTAAQINGAWQAFNRTVISDPTLLALDASLHPYGALSAEDQRKLYFFFLWLNVADDTLRAQKKGIVDAELAEARLGNQARMTYSEREFLEAHVFPRGYQKTAIVKELRARWEAGG